MEYPVYSPPARKGFWIDPRTKILYMALVTTLMFFVYQNIPLVFILASVPAILLFINRQYKIGLIYEGLFVLAMIAEWGKDMISPPAVLNAIIVLLTALVIRMFPTFIMGYYIIKSTKTGELIAALERWHIPQSILIPVSVICRFVPTIQDESHAITDAMRMRDIQLGSKKCRSNPSLFMEYRMIPLMMSIIKIGDELSAAALTRGLGGEKKRTNIAMIGFTRYDFLMALVSLGIVVWSVL